MKINKKIKTMSIFTCCLLFALFILLTSNRSNSGEAIPAQVMEDDGCSNVADLAIMDSQYGVSVSSFAYAKAIGYDEICRKDNINQKKCIPLSDSCWKVCEDNFRRDNKTPWINETVAKEEHDCFDKCISDFKNCMGW